MSLVTMHTWHGCVTHWLPCFALQKVHVVSMLMDIQRVFELSHDLLTAGSMKEREQGKGELCEKGR